MVVILVVVLVVAVRKLKTTLGGFRGKKSFWANITRRARVYAYMCVHVHTSFSSLYATLSSLMAVTTSLNILPVLN